MYGSVCVCVCVLQALPSTEKAGYQHRLVSKPRDYAPYMMRRPDRIISPWCWLCWSVDVVLPVYLYYFYVDRTADGGGSQAAILSGRTNARNALCFRSHIVIRALLTAAAQCHISWRARSPHDSAQPPSSFKAADYRLAIRLAVTLSLVVVCALLVYTVGLEGIIKPTWGFRSLLSDISPAISDCVLNLDPVYHSQGWCMKDLASPSALDELGNAFHVAQILPGYKSPGGLDAMFRAAWTNESPREIARHFQDYDPTSIECHDGNFLNGACLPGARLVARPFATDSTANTMGVSGARAPSKL